MNQEGVVFLGQLLHLDAQALIFFLQLLLGVRGLLGRLLDITNHVLLVETAERYAFNGIVFHKPTTFLCIWLSFYHEIRLMTRVELRQKNF